MRPSAVCVDPLAAAEWTFAMDLAVLAYEYDVFYADAFADQLDSLASSPWADLTAASGWRKWAPRSAGRPCKGRR
ncbi:MAG: hypothetical protein IT427_04580 [Pirellulales bacterium]|nr:hypothetical protein [Pirellulales bacterium]